MSIILDLEYSLMTKQLVEDIEALRLSLSVLLLLVSNNTYYLQSDLYISILYNSISSLLALPTMAQVWDYGQNSI